MNNIQNISMRELKKYIGDDRYLIVDIRSSAAYTEYHIDGAINIPYDEIMSGETELPRDKILILYCQHGSLSISATRRLMRMGYGVINTIGGIEAYKKVKFN